MPFPSAIKTMVQFRLHISMPAFVFTLFDAPTPEATLKALSLGIWASDNGGENIQTFNDDTRGRSMYPLGPQLVFVPYVDESNVSLWRLVWLTQNDRDWKFFDLRRFSNEVNRAGISYKIAIYSNSSATWCCVEISWRCGREGDWPKRGGRKREEIDLSKWST